MIYWTAKRNVIEYEEWMETKIISIREIHYTKLIEDFNVDDQNHVYPITNLMLSIKIDN